MKMPEQSLESFHFHRNAGNNWDFEETESELIQFGVWRVGYLTAGGTTYSVCKVAYPPRLTLYDKEGERLDLAKHLRNAKQMLREIQTPINAELDKQEAEFYEFWGDAALLGIAR